MLDDLVVVFECAAWCSEEWTEVVERLKMDDWLEGSGVESDKLDADWRFLREVGWWSR